ncbi:Detected protein of confused Function [Hibiscus syriacus]|uniref:Detected protein of confused Function n=1 Tax=Hibiscus syriacus TaxID=106335 RepID=A0A6A2YTG8_HIBSY|nr:Detected protein of confused Function [Hibiscus syriacus]
MDSPQGSTLTTNTARLVDGSTARREVSYVDCLPVYVKELIAGGAAGAFAKTTVAPLERTKILFQTRTDGAILLGGIRSLYPRPAYGGVRDVLTSVYKEGGMRGLYRGVGPTLAGILPYAALKFYVYEVLKTHVPEEQQKPILMHLSCGAAAGLIGQTFTYPLDVVRRQMQVESLQCSTIQGGSTRYRNTLDGLTTIVRNQGWRQLFAGLSINYMKMVPSVAVGFAAYDMMKVWLRIPPRQKSRTASSG